MHRYEVIVYWSNENELFVAEVPELPGCAAHGGSPETALAEAQEAISLWIDTTPHRLAASACFHRLASMMAAIWRISSARARRFAA